VLWPHYRPVEMTLLAPQLANDSAHSYLLQAAATTGVLGLVPALLLVAVPAVLLYRSGDREPFVASVLVVVGVAYLAQGMVSVGSGMSAVAGDPGRAEHWNELGRGLFAARRWRDSVEAFDAARARLREDSTYTANAARALAQMALTGDGSRGGVDAALAVAREAVALDPNDLSPHLAL